MSGGTRERSAIARGHRWSTVSLNYLEIRDHTLLQSALTDTDGLLQPMMKFCVCLSSGASHGNEWKHQNFHAFVTNLHLAR